MKILVTGSAGFIGSHLAERLATAGHEVVGVDALTDYYSRSLKEFNQSQVKEKGVEFHELDLVSDDLSEITKDIDVIYHLAAQPGISSSTSFDTYVQNNILATRNLIETFKQKNKLKIFINISTSSVYGVFATSDEETAVQPISDYGVTKLAAEQLALAASRSGDLPVCSVRLFSVYGPRERPEKLYPKLIRSILMDEEFSLYKGSKDHVRSFTYVSDIIDGFMAILDKTDECIGEIINLGTDQAITTRRGIEIVEEILGKKVKVKTVPKRPGDQIKTQANIKKARQLFNYEPKVLAEEGLKQEVEWFKENWSTINN